MKLKLAVNFAVAILAASTAFAAQSGEGARSPEGVSGRAMLGMRIFMTSPVMRKGVFQNRLIELSQSPAGEKIIQEMIQTLGIENELADIDLNSLRPGLIDRLHHVARLIHERLQEDKVLQKIRNCGIAIDADHFAGWADNSQVNTSASDAAFARRVMAHVQHETGLMSSSGNSGGGASVRSSMPRLVTADGNVHQFDADRIEATGNLMTPVVLNVTTQFDERRSIMSELRELAVAFKTKVIFGQVILDVVKDRPLPTLVLMHAGLEVSSLYGHQSVQSITAWLNKYLQRDVR